MVIALAQDAGVTVETVDDGFDLPVYLVDSSQSFYDHCLALARPCGFDLYTTEEGKLVFSQFTVTASDHTFRYGEHILVASAEESIPLDKVTVVPESPASSAGDQTASWLVKDPSGHTSAVGTGPAAVLISDPLLRTREAAERAAQARLDASRRDATCGLVELMGTPQVHLGHAVALEGVPDGGVDGTYQVMAIRHVLDRRRGFRTVLGLGGIPRGSVP